MRNLLLLGSSINEVEDKKESVWFENERAKERAREILSMAELSDLERVVMEHRFIEGLSYRQSAAALGLARMKIKRTVMKALDKLRRKLDN